MGINSDHIPHNMRQLPSGLDAVDTPFPHQAPVYFIPWYKRRRVVVFFSTFLLLCLIGLSWSFSRPDTYRSSASLLTTSASDQNKYWDVGSNESTQDDLQLNRQHVALQNEILTDPLLLEKVQQNLLESSQEHADEGISNLDISRMLSTSPVPSSRLIQLNADGPDPAVLPILVNSWIESYKHSRTKYINDVTNATIAALDDQVKTLESKIASKRNQIDAFRQKSDILSNEREENQVLARLRGLNTSLNVAEDEELKTKAKLDAVKAAIAEGRPVFLENSDDNERSIAVLEEAAQVLREKMATLEQQYTPEYIQLVPDLKAVPDQLETIEAKIAKLSQKDQDVVLSDAIQAYSAAKQKTLDVRAQLEQHKGTAQRFTTKFSEHEALRKELMTLEERHQTTKDKVLQATIQLHQKYPQIEVVRAAFLPSSPIGPDYARDAAIIVASALLIALITVLLVEFLAPEQKLSSSGITLSGIHMYPDAGRGQFPSMQQTPQIRQQIASGALGAPMPRELNGEEITRIWQHAPLKGKQLLSILLSGINIDEAATLTKDNFDQQQNIITLGGRHSRSLYLSPILKAALAESDDAPLWQASNVSSEDLRVFLSCTAADADIDNSEQIDESSLQHTYLCFLVRQGAKLSELENITGYLSPGFLNFYRTLSPNGPGLALDELDLVFPIHPQ